MHENVGAVPVADITKNLGVWITYCYEKCN